MTGQIRSKSGTVWSAEFGPTLVDSGPTWAEIRRSRPKIGQIRAQFSRPNSCRLWPTLGHLWQNFARVKPTFVEFGPRLVHSGRIRFAHFKPTSAEFWPRLVQSGLVESGQCRAKVSRIRPNLGRFRAIGFGRVRANLGGHGQRESSRFGLQHLGVSSPICAPNPPNLPA